MDPTAQTSYADEPNQAKNLTLPFAKSVYEARDYVVKTSGFKLPE